MRVGYRWLLKTAGLRPDEAPLAEVARRLTMAGLEVEGVTDLGAGHGKIVTARILTRERHPNADKLSLCDVDAGGGTTYRIVCGANNMGPGDLVPLALPGAELPGGVKIREGKIRGEASQGMMCGAREMGWSDDADGLLILPPDGPPSGPSDGPPDADGGDGLYGLGEPFDALIELKVTPNHPDCLAMRGLARELRAGLGLPPLTDTAPAVEEAGAPAAIAVKVRLDEPGRCPRYTGRVIRGVTVGPGPVWLTRAVESAGLRAINNVVDVTNYIMLLHGQPLHAFDLARVEGGEVIIRTASTGEKATLLDGTEATLTADDLLIADAAKAIAVAGVMGCANSEITATTVDVFVECAAFAPTGVRRTARRLGKITDSSTRFERGIDVGTLDEVLDRATAMIVRVAGGAAAPGRLEAGPGVEPTPAIDLDCGRVRTLLGMAGADGTAELTDREIRGALVALEFVVEAADAGNPALLRVGVPGWRPDVAREDDLLEEVARVVGYDRIPETLPRLESRPSDRPAARRHADTTRDLMVRLGLLEASTYGFVAEAWLATLGYEEARDGWIRVRNPLSAEFGVMRPSLVPGLLAAALANQNHGTNDVRLFEVGQVFRARAGEAAAGPACSGAAAIADLRLAPVEETAAFAALISGPATEATWRGAAKPADFFDGKALAEGLLGAFGVEPGSAEYRPVTESDLAGPGGADLRLLHPGKSAIACMPAGAGGSESPRVLLAVGELHPAVRQALGLKRAVQMVFGRLDALGAASGGARRPVRAVPEFPSMTRDLALVASNETPASEIAAVIVRRAKSLLAGLRLFDMYEDDRLRAEGRRSLAYQLRFEAADRTLTDDEVNQCLEKILADLKAKLGVELRAAAVVG